MKILLLQDHDKLGRAGEVVIVKDGYARNYLIPAGMASRAMPKNVKALEAQRKAAQAKASKALQSFQAIADRLRQLDLVAKVQVGEENRMFGAVTSGDIAALLEEKGVSIDRRIIRLDEPIKALGDYTIPIKVHAAIEASVRLRVEPMAAG